MRSTRPSSARHRRGPRGRLLPSVATLVDQATAGEPGHVLVHVDGPVHPEVALGLKPLDPGVHPFDVLAGFTAPASWTAFGIRATGRAHHLEDPRAAPARTAVTFLLDRHGQEASVLRRGDAVEDLKGPATGTIPDLCRRVLQLPTPPAPATTARLWTCTWLDRLMARGGEPRHRQALSSAWRHVAALHPAAEVAGGAALDDPAALVRLARAHAAATPWAQLRRSSTPLALPSGSLPPDVARWMDDGFFARWTIGAYPPVATLAGDLRELLGDPVGPQLLEVVAALLE